MNIQKEFKERLEEKLDEFYPKGEVLNVIRYKEKGKPLFYWEEYRPRSRALLLNVYANIILEELLKEKGERLEFNATEGKSIYEGTNISFK